VDWRMEVRSSRCPPVNAEDVAFWIQIFLVPSPGTPLVITHNFILPS
jgi:hypothetical protein